VLVYTRDAIARPEDGIYAALVCTTGASSRVHAVAGDVRGAIHGERDASDARRAPLGPTC